QRAQLLDVLLVETARAGSECLAVGIGVVARPCAAAVHLDRRRRQLGAGFDAVIDLEDDLAVGAAGVGARRRGAGAIGRRRCARGTRQRENGEELQRILHVHTMPDPQGDGESEVQSADRNAITSLYRRVRTSASTLSRLGIADHGPSSRSDSDAAAAASSMQRANGSSLSSAAANAP